MRFVEMEEFAQVMNYDEQYGCGGCEASGLLADVVAPDFHIEIAFKCGTLTVHEHFKEIELLH